MNSLFLLRGIERIICVMIGAFSVYLGYALFIKLPEKTDSEGKAILPGGISIYFSRVGPGVFFALFGTLIIIYAIITQIQFKDVVMSSPSNVPSAVITTTIFPPLNFKPANSNSATVASPFRSLAHHFLQTRNTVLYCLL